MFHGQRSDVLVTAGEGSRAAVGVHLSFLCPELIEFCGLLGFKWLLLDAEHQPLTAHLCRDLVRAADLMEMPCFVRVPEIKAPVIESFLDVGVRGILAPGVSSAADAEALVAAVKFSPEGRRGAAGKSRAARYGLSQTAEDYIRRANQVTLTAVLVETQQGIESLESIIAVPGLDYISLGPNDLGLSRGIHRGANDPRVRALIDDAQARLRIHAKPLLAIVSTATDAQQAVAAGARLVAVSDAALLASSSRLLLEELSR